MDTKPEITINQIQRKVKRIIAYQKRLVERGEPRKLNTKMESAIANAFDAFLMALQSGDLDTFRDFDPRDEREIIEAIKNHPFCHEIVLSEDEVSVSMWSSNMETDLAAFLQTTSLNAAAALSLLKKGELYISEYHSGVFGNQSPRKIMRIVEAKHD